MAEIPQILHRFISSVPDDPTIPEAVRPQHDWNDSHILAGGQDGQLVVADSTADDGFSFLNPADAITGTLVLTTSGSSSYSGAGPTPNLGTTVFTLTRACKVQVFIEASLQDSSPQLQNCSLTVVENNLVLRTYKILSGGETITYLQTRTLSPGTYEYKGAFTPVTNPIVTAVLSFTIFAFSQ